MVTPIKVLFTFYWRTMVIKVDKSEEFIKSGRKLITEYDSEGLLKKIKKNDDRELWEMENKKQMLSEQEWADGFVGK
tara:strand:- start:422 stop:652 length:231 start_codon:yes stop_codon:yes gene_type:complete